MDASELALDAHLGSGRFRSGEAKGRWALIGRSWPFVFIDVAIRDGRRIALRFECSGYPIQAPTAMPWNTTNNTALAASEWPQGGRVSQVFNPGWKNGTALYLPCDRQSFEGHPNWIVEYPSMLWDPKRDITQYVEIVHEILQSHELAVKAA